MQEKNKGGRPPKAPEDRAGGAIHFRVRGNYRAELEKAAKLAGRSLSEECEMRLNRSVQREAAIAEVFGAVEHQELLFAVGSVVRLVSTMSEDAENPAVQARAAIIRLIEDLSGEAAAQIISEADKSGDAWKEAATRVSLLERGLLKSMSEIMGR